MKRIMFVAALIALIAIPVELAAARGGRGGGRRGGWGGRSRGASGIPGRNRGDWGRGKRNDKGRDRTVARERARSELLDAIKRDELADA